MSGGPGRMTIASIVEGEGELTALPVLVRRMLYQQQIWDADVRRPFLVGRGRLVKQGGLEAAIEVVARSLPSPCDGGVLVMIDADDDCPATFGPELLRRAEAVRPGLRVSVVLANREFESWFLAAAPSLGGRAGLPEGLEVPEDSETRRDCKGWLSHQRADQGRYRPRVDQAALADAFNLELAGKNSRSFRKFAQDVNYLITGTRGK